MEEHVDGAEGALEEPREGVSSQVQRAEDAQGGKHRSLRPHRCWTGRRGQAQEEGRRQLCRVGQGEGQVHVQGASQDSAQDVNEVWRSSQEGDLQRRQEIYKECQGTDYACVSDVSLNM